MTKILNFGLLFLALYLSYCTGSYFAAINKSGYINLERLSQVEQNIHIVDLIDDSSIDKLRDISIQTIQLELKNVIDAKSEMSRFSIIDFLSAPWYLIKYRQDVDENSIISIQKRLEVVKRE